MTNDEKGEGMGRPRPQVTLWILGAVALAGLVAQFIAAESAFALLGRGPVYAKAAALLIEAAAVGEALVAMRYRDRLALGLLGVALAVSGIYNFTQARLAAPELERIVLWALAIGPLAALTSIGLLLGAELEVFEGRLAAWREGLRAQELLAQRQADEERGRLRRVEAQEREWARQDEIREREHRLREEELATRRQERRERNRRLTQMNADGSRDRTVTGQGDDGRTGDRSVSGVTGQWPDKAAFLADPDRPGDLTGRELAEMAGINDRTARRWLADAKNGHGTADGHG